MTKDRPIPDAQSPPSLIAGGYARHGAAGLYALRLHGAALIAGAPVAPIRNVSAGVRFGASRWFFVDEEAGEILLLDSSRAWHLLARFDAGGAGPCHLALDPPRRLLAVANYESGTTARFCLDGNGLPQPAPVTYQHRGNGPVAGRQDGPHAHWVGFAPNGMLYVTDLGADRILGFGISRTAPSVAYAAPPGSGPRQLAFHPTLPCAYLVSELASTLTVLRTVQDGGLRAEAICSTLPAGSDTDSLGGAILLDGDRLHVSNRGHDSIATFEVATDGSVTLIGHQASGGRSPRFLLIHRDHLLVAHEEGGGVTALPLDPWRLPGAPAARANIPGSAFLGDLS